jgi:RHS repeat-associated protein
VKLKVVSGRKSFNDEVHQGNPAAKPRHALGKFVLGTVGASGRAVFYRARYFDANTGRFLSEDPIALARGVNNFHFDVFTNPLNFNDSSGNTPLVVLLEPLIGPAVAVGIRVFA